MSNAQRFLDGYLDAWRTNDPDAVRSLFSSDAVYRGGAHELDLVVGIDRIVSAWDEWRDEPGSWGYEGAVDLETETAAVIRGVTTYTAGPKSGVYDNVWLVRFDEEGRAAEFQDWWFESKK